MDDEPVLQKFSVASTSTLTGPKAKKSFTYASPLSFKLNSINNSILRNGHVSPLLNGAQNALEVLNGCDKKRANSGESLSSSTKKGRVDDDDDDYGQYESDQDIQRSAALKAKLLHKLHQYAKASASVRVKTACACSSRIRELEEKVEFWRQKAAKLEKIAQSLSATKVKHVVDVSCQTAVSARTDISEATNSGAGTVSSPGTSFSGINGISVTKCENITGTAVLGSSGSKVNQISHFSQAVNHLMLPPKTNTVLVPAPNSSLPPLSAKPCNFRPLPTTVEASAVETPSVVQSNVKRRKPAQGSCGDTVALPMPPPPLLPSGAAYAGQPRQMTHQEYRSVITQRPVHDRMPSSSIPQVAVHPVQAASGLRPSYGVPSGVSSRPDAREVVDLTNDDEMLAASASSHVISAIRQHTSSQGCLQGSRSLPALGQFSSAIPLQTNYSAVHIAHGACSPDVSNGVGASFLNKEVAAGVPQVFRTAATDPSVFYPRQFPSIITSAAPPSNYPVPAQRNVAIVGPLKRSPVPVPIIQARRNEGGGVVLSWDMEIPRDVNVAKYEIMAKHTTASGQQTILKAVGQVDALPLPMACTLTQFSAGDKYTFYVRAIDDHRRVGSLSAPIEIEL